MKDVIEMYDPFDPYSVDWFEVDHVFKSLWSKRLTPEALSQRIARSLRKGDKELYITLKLAQSLFSYERKKTNED